VCDIAQGELGLPAGGVDLSGNSTSARLVPSMDHDGGSFRRKNSGDTFS
jgi:hypothetical protein